MNATAALMVIGFAFFIAFTWSGCGVTAGPLTMGTTGFLQEANRARLALDGPKNTTSVIAADGDRKFVTAIPAGLED